MSANGVRKRQHNAVADAHAARMAAAGSGNHLYVEDLASASAPVAARDLDDCVHLLCALYGRHPGIVDIALERCPAGPVHDWMSAAANAFERERLFLVKLTAAAGPVPSTPGNAETEAALLAQRHALETLVRSERAGCALGALTALVGDWPAIRSLLTQAAARVGAEIPPCSLPDESSIADVLALGVQLSGPSAERAIRFGSEQLLLQHRSLFDLLEARCEAREGF